MVERVDVRVAGVILVDPLGRLLLQLRDGNTQVDPHRWCLPGGHVDPGEDPLTAAHRELYEETGLKVEELRLFWHGKAPSGQFPGAIGEFSTFYAPTSATDEDVVCGEGAAMRFVDAADVPSLEFGRANGEIVPRFLASPQYRQLVGSIDPHLDRRTGVPVQPLADRYVVHMRAVRPVGGGGPSWGAASCAAGAYLRT